MDLCPSLSSELVEPVAEGTPDGTPASAAGLSRGSLDCEGVLRRCFLPPRLFRPPLLEPTVDPTEDAAEEAEGRWWIDVGTSFFTTVHVLSWALRGCLHCGQVFCDPQTLKQFPSASQRWQAQRVAAREPTPGFAHEHRRQDAREP